ncbi:spore coat protein [Alicyclobacillaceae bacterium I2511]|nr:spore coat protein [Alicyclobacillaceae bacterium I2511]
MNQGNMMMVGAHEFIGMNEAMAAKSAKIELLSAFSQQATDPNLRAMFEQQAQQVWQNYQEGLQLMQSTLSQSGVSVPTGNNWNVQGQGVNSVINNFGGINTGNMQPKIGLRQPSYPTPNVHAQNLSDRTMSAVILNLHKFHAVAWLQYALECTRTDLRSYLMEGTLMCDRMAYNLFMHMNQKGDYQVPKLDDHVMNTMVQAYSAGQVPQVPMM